MKLKLSLLLFATLLALPVAANRVVNHGAAAPPAPTGPFAVMESSITQADETGGTTKVVTMPSGVVSGDLLVVEMMSSGTTGITGTGWTSLGSPSNLHVLWRVSDGTEGATQSFTTPAFRASWVVRRWSGADGIEGVLNTSDGNPPAVTASWGSANNVFVAVTSGQASDWSVDTAPTNYSGLLTIGSASSTAASRNEIGSATRQLAAVSDDAGVFEITTGTGPLSPKSFAYVIRPIP